MLSVAGAAPDRVAAPDSSYDVVDVCHAVQLIYRQVHGLLPCPEGDRHLRGVTFSGQLGQVIALELALRLQVGVVLHKALHLGLVQRQRRVIGQQPAVAALEERDSTLLPA